MRVGFNNVFLLFIIAQYIQTDYIIHETNEAIKDIISYM